MRTLLGALAVLTLAACTPPGAGDGANAAVEAIYATAQQNIGHSITPDEAIPMTDGLRALLDSAEAAADARNEPFIEGDLALNCQDCTAISDLVIGPQTGPYQEPEIPGHQWVQASFTLNGDEPRVLLYDMVETPQGWRVDNILAEGFNLRTESQRYIDEPAPAEPAAP